MFVTNFSVNQKELYEKAIEQYKIACPEDKLWLSKTATDRFERILPNHNSLHRAKHIFCLSKFWRIFDELQKNLNVNENLN